MSDPVSSQEKIELTLDSGIEAIAPHLGKTSAGHRPSAKLNLKDPKVNWKEAQNEHL